jgi:hypothetical protein
MRGWGCSADRTRLHEISLVSGNLTGNFAILRHLETVLAQETAVLQPLIEKFPTQINREIISKIREFLSDNRDFFWKVASISRAAFFAQVTGAICSCGQFCR